MQNSLFIPLEMAHFCTECRAIGNSAALCPCCKSSALLLLSRVIVKHEDSCKLSCNGELYEDRGTVGIDY